MSEMIEIEKVILTIDKSNIITAVGGSWNKAAQEGNASETLAPENVIGKSIEKFLGGDVTQMYYDAVFKLCRLKNEVLERDYRCDSPTHERYMKMRLIPLEKNQIRMEHELIKEVPFVNQVNILDITHSKEVKSNIGLFVKRCSICNKLNCPQSELWLAPENISKEKPVNIKVIHTVCQDCKNKKWF